MRGMAVMEVPDRPRHRPRAGPGARSLAEYPLIRQEFAAARLSYAKARALTRIVTPETEADLVEMATPMTAGQLERFAQAHRRVSESGRGRPRPARKLAWTPAGDLDYQFRAILPAEAAAVVFQALRAARNDLEHPHDDHDHASAFPRTRLGQISRRDAEAGINLAGAQPPPAEMEPTESLADALVQICADYLGTRAATADNPDTYQVIVHAGVRAITGAEPSRPWAGRRPGARRSSRGMLAGSVSAETLPFWHPAHQDRCHLDDGPAISPAALALIGCNATISTMIHDLSGAIIDVGRRTRNPRLPSAAPSASATGAAASTPAATPAAPTPTTSSTGPTAARPISPASSASAADTTARPREGHHHRHHRTGFAFHTKDGTPIPDSPALPEPPQHRRLPRRRHHPHHDHPPHSGERLNLSPRHLDRLRQRPHPSQPPRNDPDRTVLTADEEPRIGVGGCPCHRCDDRLGSELLDVPLVPGRRTCTRASC